MAGCEVVIVGGGFAGVVAARELSRAGREVVLLEGRDRLGGRTWSKADALPGRTLELGGAWVHWFQLPGLQAPEGRVVFAGSELANGWGGFIDGAIESGLRAARQAGAVLG
jgi:monoamine oxidase